MTDKSNLVCLNKNEDIVNSNGKNKKWNYFNNDKSCWNSHVAEEANTRSDRNKNNKNSRQSK